MRQSPVSGIYAYTCVLTGNDDELTRMLRSAVSGESIVAAMLVTVWESMSKDAGDRSVDSVLCATFHVISTMRPFSPICIKNEVVVT